MENNPLKYIVITSIFRPTEAVMKFSLLDNHRLLVVGDNKTPGDWHCNAVEFLSVEKQRHTGFQLAAALPFNHYCRKMIGYLEAIRAGAEVIIDTDDDNIPKKDWGFPDFEGAFRHIQPGKGFFNVYQLFTDQKIWPRGLPLRLINEVTDFKNPVAEKSCRVGVWQGLADEDPDVDAVYRLTNNTPCFFREEQPVVLAKGTLSPFNSQNTAIRKELFALLYLPTTVTFRFTDILRSLVAQPIMWLYDFELGFTGATVVQKRNPHDYMQDFRSEIPMYEFGEQVIEWVEKAISPAASIGDNLMNAYHSLLHANIVGKQELLTVEAWLNDITNKTL
ncbi:DUF288 domain-containing protein [Flavisolibacter sp. BT320]|nr:DUF288 domain-containing protein [Flavisolibacter longurius]